VPAHDALFFRGNRTFPVPLEGGEGTSSRSGEKRSATGLSHPERKVPFVTTGPTEAQPEEQGFPEKRKNDSVQHAQERLAVAGYFSRGGGPHGPSEEAVQGKNEEVSFAELLPGITRWWAHSWSVGRASLVGGMILGTVGEIERAFWLEIGKRAYSQ